MVPTFGTEEYTNESCLEMSDYMFLLNYPQVTAVHGLAKAKPVSVGPNQSYGRQTPQNQLARRVLFKWIKHKGIDIHRDLVAQSP